MTAGATVASRRVIRMGGRAPVGIIAMICAVLLFSSSSTLVKWADTPGSVIAFWRMLISVVLWWIVIVGRKARTGRPAPTRRTWRLTLPAGLFFGLNITLFFTAIGRTSIAHAEFITALSPILLVPLGAVLFHERPDRRALPWGAVSLVGLAIVLFAGGSQGGATVGGDLIVVVVVMLWIGYLLTGRRARATVDVFDFMATMMPIGVLTAAPVALLIAGGDIWPLSAKAWLAAGLLGVLTGMLGHGLIAFSQREIADRHDRDHPGRPAGVGRRLELPDPRRGDPAGPDPGHGARARRARRLHARQPTASLVTRARRYRGSRPTRGARGTGGLRGRLPPPTREPEPGNAGGGIEAPDASTRTVADGRRRHRRVTARPSRRRRRACRRA